MRTLVPIAPFTVVNLVAGASGISMFDFFVGTLLGMLPGLILISAVGHQIALILTAPTAGGIALPLAGAVACPLDRAVDRCSGHGIALLE